MRTASSAWMFFGAVVGAAAAIYVSLPRRGPRRAAWLRDVAAALGVAGLGGLVAWLMAVSRLRGDDPSVQPLSGPLCHLFVVLALGSAGMAITRSRASLAAGCLTLAALSVAGVLVMAAAPMLAGAIGLLCIAGIAAVWALEVRVARQEQAGRLTADADRTAGRGLTIVALLSGMALAVAAGGPLAKPAHWPQPAVSPMSRLAAGEPVGGIGAIGRELIRMRWPAVMLTGALLAAGAVAVAALRGLSDEGPAAPDEQDEE